MGRYAAFISIVMLLMTSAWAGASESGNLDEIRHYFELRDTLSLVNLEMKRALAQDSRSAMLANNQAENELADVLAFLEGRIEQFAAIKTPLKYHYIKKLSALFRESRQLQASLQIKIRANAIAAAPGAAMSLTKSPEATVEELKTHPRPYFNPIDLRTLLSPRLRDANKMRFTVASHSIPTIMPQKTPVFVEPANVVMPPIERSVASLVKSPVNVDIAVKLPVASGSTLPASAAISVEKTAKTVSAKEPPAQPTLASVAAVLPVPPVKPVLAPSTLQPVLPDKPTLASPTLQSKLPIKPVLASATLQPVLPIKPVLASATLQPVLPIKPVLASATLQPVLPVVTEVASSAIIPAQLVASTSPVMRPLAVMIENHNRSRPQSGLDQADLVYEMPVEGGITRFMAVYTKLPGLLGPVRSCREYFVDRALEVDALYVHCGSSPGGYAYLSKSGINSVDEIRHSKPFFRDKSRKAPHNLYGSGDRIRNYMAAKISMQLKAAPKLINYGVYRLDTAEPGESVRIRYHGNYMLDFKFENGAYQRYMNNVLHVDRETQKPLRASAVVIQIAAMRVIDKAGRQEMSFIGSGRAWVLEKGKKTEVTWSKSNPRELTSYKDAGGGEYLFPKDLPVWVQVVSPSHKMFFNGIEEIAPIAGKEAGNNASATAETGKQG